MILSPPKDWREGRCLCVWKLHDQGWKRKDIVTALEVIEGTVSQWFKRAREPWYCVISHLQNLKLAGKLSYSRR